MSEQYLYIHDMYGNEPHFTATPKQDWESLKALGGEWAEIGELYWSADGYYNDQQECVYQRVTNELLESFEPEQLARMPGIENLTTLYV